MTGEVRTLVSYPDGESVLAAMEPALDKIGGLVSGPLEAIHLTSCHIYVNENGKLDDQEPNLVATMFAMQLGWLNPFDDVLTGPAVFLGNGPGGREADLPDDVVSAFIAL